MFLLFGVKILNRKYTLSLYYVERNVFSPFFTFLSTDSSDV